MQNNGGCTLASCVSTFFGSFVFSLILHWYTTLSLLIFVPQTLDVIFHSVGIAVASTVVNRWLACRSNIPETFQGSKKTKVKIQSLDLEQQGALNHFSYKKRAYWNRDALYCNFTATGLHAESLNQTKALSGPKGTTNLFRRCLLSLVPRPFYVGF